MFVAAAMIMVMRSGSWRRPCVLRGDDNDDDDDEEFVCDDNDSIDDNAFDFIRSAEDDEDNCEIAVKNNTQLLTDC